MANEFAAGYSQASPVPEMPLAGSVRVEKDPVSGVRQVVAAVDDLPLVDAPLYVGAWAGRPAASSVPAGSLAIITNIPAGGTSRWRAGATIWTPEGGAIVLGQSGVAKAAVTGSTAATTFDLCTLPAGLLGANGLLEIDAVFSWTGAAGNKTAQVRFANAGFPARLVSVALNTGTSLAVRGTFQNRGVANQNQVVYNLAGGLGAGGTAETTSVDTAVDQVLQCLVQLAVGTDSITLERWAVVARPF